MIIEVEIKGAVARISGENLAIAVMDKASGELISGFRADEVPPRQEVIAHHARQAEIARLQRKGLPL